MTGSSCVKRPRAAVFHRAEQRVIKPLHRLATGRRGGVEGIGRHADAEPADKSHGFPR